MSPVRGSCSRQRFHCRIVLARGAGSGTTDYPGLVLGPGRRPERRQQTRSAGQISADRHPLARRRGKMDRPGDVRLHAAHQSRQSHEIPGSRGRKSARCERPPDRRKADVRILHRSPAFPEGPAGGPDAEQQRRHRAVVLDACLARPYPGVPEHPERQGAVSLLLGPRIRPLPDRRCDDTIISGTESRRRYRTRTRRIGRSDGARNPRETGTRHLAGTRHPRGQSAVPLSGEERNILLDLRSARHAFASAVHRAFPENGFLRGARV